LKKSSQISTPMNYSIEKPNSLTIYHDVLLTIQHLSQQQTTNSLWNQPPYHTLDYIDEQSIYHIPLNQLIQTPSWSWIKQSNSEIPHRFSTRHRNVNRQLSVNIPLIQSNSDRTLPPIVKFNQISNFNINEKHNDIEILKISVPLLTQYPLIKSSSSIISFDSQIELDEFNQMTSVCMDNELLSVDRQSQNNTSKINAN